MFRVRQKRAQQALLKGASGTYVCDHGLPSTGVWVKTPYNPTNLQIGYPNPNVLTANRPTSNIIEKNIKNRFNFYSLEVRNLKNIFFLCSPMASRELRSRSKNPLPPNIAAHHQGYPDAIVARNSQIMHQCLHLAITV